uniref:glycosyltransferase n=1 Tax=uncultured Draconibacterium sp. TaxID=1573823 RepID=UPI00321722A8
MRKKIIFLQNKLLHYRIPLYNYLHDNYGDVTVLHCERTSSNENILFKETTIEDHNIKSFHFQIGLKNIVNEYDIIVAMFDLKWPSIWTLPLRLNPKKKFFFWGIGVSTEKGLDVNKKFDFFRYKIGKLSTGLIFYSDYPVKNYLQKGFNKKSLFVAHNTVDVENNNIVEDFQGNKFIFIGSLSKRKRIDILICAFADVLKSIPSHIILEIIGDGDERESLNELIDKLGLQERVFIKGPIFDSSRKAEIFKSAIATISPGQAGLSVLESFAYGVPFITSRDAITGGEIFNIHEKQTGYFMKNQDELSKLLIHLSNNPSVQLKLRHNCIHYYQTNRRISDMAKGFISAFEA